MLYFSQPQYSRSASLADLLVFTLLCFGISELSSLKIHLFCFVHLYVKPSPLALDHFGGCPLDK